MRPIYSLFPKFLNALSVEQLADTLQDTGFDCVDLVIRDGYWVTLGGLAQEAEAFVRFMQQKGIRVEFATAGFSPEQLVNDAKPLQILANLGIKSFRMSYFNYKEGIGLTGQMKDARSQMEKMAELCAKHRIKAVYQVHHGYGQLIQHSYAALSLVEGLPAEYVGVMLDPGNQFHEGRENFKKAFAVLGDYFVAIGVKDVVQKQDGANRHLPNKGWSAAWTPCQEGVTNWHDIGESLQKLDRTMVCNLQPFYHQQNQDLLISTLKEELAYIKGAFGEAGR